MTNVKDYVLPYGTTTARRDYARPICELVCVETEGYLAAGTTTMGGGHEKAYTDGTEWEAEEDDN